MANERGKSIDTTHLSIDQAEKRGFIHRDYIAHCLRWSHVVKHIGQSGRYKTTRILDVGCGTDLPLAKTLYTSRMAVQQYVGVDYNRPDKFDTSVFHTGKMPVRAFGGVDFARDVHLLDDQASYTIGANIGPFKLPNVITCFEVLEHVEPEHARRMLERMHELVDRADDAGDPCTVFVSTPCYDEMVGAAANHVSEIRREALGALMEEVGFKITGNWGTFASQRDYKTALQKEYPSDGVRIFDKLSEYYDSNYVATIMAPLFPQHSRNNLWQLEIRSANDQTYLFPDLEQVKQPWSSSANWRDFRAEPEAHEEAEAAEG